MCEVKAKAGWNITFKEVSIYISRVGWDVHAWQHETNSWVKMPWSCWDNKHPAGEKMDWGLWGSPLFVCLLLVFAEKTFLVFVFFYDAICATARKACIVCKCKSLMNDHCVEALMTIPFELPTLLFFHGFKLYAKENKAVMDIFWLSNYVKWNCPYVLFVMARSRAQDGLRKAQKFNKLDSKLKNTDIYITYSLLRMSLLTLTVLVPQHLLH